MEANNNNSLPQISLPDIPGIEQMTALQMNGVHFDKRHTVLTPEILESLGTNPSASPV